MMQVMRCWRSLIPDCASLYDDLHLLIYILVIMLLPLISIICTFGSFFYSFDQHEMISAHLFGLARHSFAVWYVPLLSVCSGDILGVLMAGALLRSCRNGLAGVIDSKYYLLSPRMKYLVFRYAIMGSYSGLYCQAISDLHSTAIVSYVGQPLGIDTLGKMASDYLQYLPSFPILR